LEEKIIYIIAGCNGAGKTTQGVTTISMEVLDEKNWNLFKK
jgi:predicted ABC-type ATPase